MTDRIYLNNNSKDVYLEAIQIYENNNEKSDSAEAEKKARPAVIICPGGGYFCVGTTEGAPVAEKFAANGYQPFILNYSIMENACFDIENPEDFAPANDISNAIDYISSNYIELNVIPDNITISAFSAGAHLAFRHCLTNTKKSTANPVKALILVYPFIDFRYKIERLKKIQNAEQNELFAEMAQMIFGKYPVDDNQLSAFSNYDLLNSLDDNEIKNLPPIFIYHAKNDRMVPFQSSEDIINLFKEKDADFTAFIQDKGEHANPFFDPSWFSEAISWLHLKTGV